jgi:cytidine deaminase
MADNKQAGQTSHPSGLEAKQIAELYRLATEVAHHAYAPYSSFRVGAALLLSTGEIVTGCNVENASYRLTTCAEQSAIVSAIGQYGPEIKLRAIAVANLNDTASEPCGACRQTIFEFSTSGTWIFYPAAGGTIADCSIADILPAAFQLAP